MAKVTSNKAKKTSKRESGVNIIDQIRQSIAASGSSNNQFFRIRDNERKRVRFLNDLDEASKVIMHDKWQELNPTLCREMLGEECEYCDDREIRKRENYVWQVWSYEDKALKLFMYAASKQSPVDQMLAAYEEYGSITDRDFVLRRRGERTDTTYSLSPLDKSTFKGGKNIKMFTLEQIMEMLSGDKPKDSKKKTVKSKSKVSKKKIEEEDDDDDIEELDDEDDDDSDEDEDEDED